MTRAFAEMLARTILTLFLVIMCVGCVPAVYRDSTASILAPDQVATIKGSSKFGVYVLFGVIGGYDLTIMSIDRTNVPYAKTYEINSEAHSIGVSLEWGGQLCGYLGCFYLNSDICEIHITPQQGHSYVIEADIKKNPVEIFLKDKETGEVTSTEACLKTIPEKSVAPSHVPF